MTQTMVLINNPHQLRPAPFPAGRADTMHPAGYDEKLHSGRGPERSAAFGPAWLARLKLHLLLAAIPVLAISAHVFWLVSLRTVGLFVLLPLLEALLVLVIARPDRSDRLILAGFLWGLIACAGYDAFRLPTIYVFHLWKDFFGAVGAWAVGDHSNFLVGYIWRYVGDGGGIAVAFFAVAATLGAGCWPRWRVMSFAIAYAVCPVWTGLVLTDLIAPSGRALFPISLATLTCSLIGHLIYGVILGVGYWSSRRLETLWPIRLNLLAGRSLTRVMSPMSRAISWAWAWASYAEAQFPVDRPFK